MAYYQANEPYNREAGNEGFQWGKAAGAYGVAAGMALAQDGTAYVASKYMRKADNKYVKNTGQFIHDLMYDKDGGKFLNENKGVQKASQKIGEVFGKKNGAQWAKNTNLFKYIPNLVPGKKGGQILSYGAIPLAGALVAGFTGQTKEEIATKTVSDTLNNM